MQSQSNRILHFDELVLSHITCLFLVLLLPFVFTQGYRRYYNKLRDFLSTQSFAGDIILIDKEDRGVTGTFDVTIMEDNEEPMLIHSKRFGQGRAETVKEKMAIAEQIQEYLDQM